MPLDFEDPTKPLHIIRCNTPGCPGKIILEMHEKGDFECPKKCGFKINKSKADAEPPKEGK